MSLDTGNTWSDIKNIFSGHPITACAKNNGMFFADAGMLYRSTNIEKNWQNISVVYIKSTMGPPQQIYF